MPSNHGGEDPLGDLVNTINRIRQGWLQLTNSPAVQMGRQLNTQIESILEPMRNWENLLPPDVLAGVRDIQDLSRNIRNSPAFQAAEQLLDMYQALSSSELASTLAEIMAEGERLQQLYSPALAAIATGIQQAAQSPTYRTEFEDSFAADLLGQITQAKDAPTLEERVDRFSELLTWLQQKLKELPRNEHVNRAFQYIIFQLVLPTFFAYAVTVGVGAVVEREETTAIQRIETKVDELTSDLAECQQVPEAVSPKRRQYYAARRIRVYEDPSAKAESLFLLPEHTLFDELEQEGQWIYMEYFDYVRGDLNRGWIYKRNLTLVQSTDEGE